MKNSFEKQLQFYELGEDYFWLSAHYDIAISALNKYLQRFPIKKNDTKILDAGCGPGHFLSRLKEHGNIYGTDYSKDALAFCLQKHSIPVFVSDLERIPIRSDYFDCIVSLETIEHVQQDVSVLREYHRILKPGGVCLISVPAFMSLWGSHDEWNKHFRRYERAELKQKIEDTGFSIKECHYIKGLFFLPLWVVRKLKKIFKTSAVKQEDDFYHVNQLVNNFLRWVIFYEYKLGLSAVLPFGVSHLCIFRKDPDPVKNVT